MRMTGPLTIAGQSREVTITGTAARQNGRLRVTGSKQLTMTDFGVKPPRLMAGTMRVHPAGDHRLRRGAGAVARRSGGGPVPPRKQPGAHNGAPRNEELRPDGDGTMRTLNRALLSALAMLTAAPLAAQTQMAANTASPADTPAAAADTTTPKKATSILAPAAMNPVPVIVGSPAAGAIGEFEPAKQSGEFNGLQLQIGGAFAQTCQSLDHETDAANSPAPAGQHPPRL